MAADAKRGLVPSLREAGEAVSHNSSRELHTLIMPCETELPPVSFSLATPWLPLVTPLFSYHARRVNNKYLFFSLPLSFL